MNTYEQYWKTIFGSLTPADVVNEYEIMPTPKGKQRLVDLLVKLEAQFGIVEYANNRERAITEVGLVFRRLFGEG